MLPYFAGLFAFLWYTARTRYKAPFYLHIASILCGLAMLAKGLAGLGLPVIVFLAYLLFTWNWRRLARAEILRCPALRHLGLRLVAVPWHHAMLARHGFPFWNELYGDNHWRRLVTGRHGDRGSFEYFIRELGYGLFPWIALAPSALAWVVMRSFGQRADGTPDAEAGGGQATRHPVVRRHLVRGGLRPGLVLHDQVPPLHPARLAWAGHGRRLFSRRRACREAQQTDLAGPAGGNAASGPGRLRPDLGAEERAAFHLAVLVRLHQHPAGPALAAGHELRPNAVGVRRSVHHSPPRSLPGNACAPSPP